MMVEEKLDSASIERSSAKFDNVTPDLSSHKRSIILHQSYGSEIMRFSPLKARMPVDFDQKFALFDEVLSNSTFLGSIEKRALKRALRKENFKSSLFQLKNESRPLYPFKIQTESEPSTPKSSNILQSVNFWEGTNS